MSETSPTELRIQAESFGGLFKQRGLSLSKEDAIKGA